MVRVRISQPEERCSVVWWYGNKTTFFTIVIYC